MRKKLILDLDTGIDDALAIAYALGSADEIGRASCRERVYVLV